MKIATWNVNSLNVRLPHLLDWLTSAQPDIVGLQELKCEDAKFPIEAIREVGYEAVFAGQKTYNGVAILSRSPITDIQRGIPGYDDPQQRVIAASIGGVRVVNAYFPNGQAPGSEKFAYKLDWLVHLTAWLKQELMTSTQLCLIGDYNIAPTDADAHPDWKETIHVSPPERAAFAALEALGLCDVFRKFEQPEKSFSWWDYRMNAFRRNFGLRIDHILASTTLADRCTACTIDKAPRTLERPSDHTPVIATFS
ncbi:MAG: exodeoxyribonuclease III [Fluviibacter sp.]